MADAYSTKKLVRIDDGIGFDPTDGTLYMCRAAILKNAPLRTVRLAAAEPDMFDVIAAAAAERNLWILRGLLVLGVVWMESMEWREEV